MTAPAAFLGALGGGRRHRIPWFGQVGWCRRGRGWDRGGGCRRCGGGAGASRACCRCLCACFVHNLGRCSVQPVVPLGTTGGMHPAADMPSRNAGLRPLIARVSSGPCSTEPPRLNAERSNWAISAPVEPCPCSFRRSQLGQRTSVPTAGLVARDRMGNGQILHKRPIPRPAM